MTKTTILCLYSGAKPDLSELITQAPEVSLHFGQSVADFGDALLEAAILLFWSGTRETFREVFLAAKQLRWTHIRFAGVDAVLFPELGQATMPVTNGSGVFGPSLGEYALLAMLYFAKDVPRLRRQQAASLWKPFDVQLLDGKSLGIVGYGDIGRNVASRAQAFGMRILACRRSASADDQPPAPVAQVFPVARLHDMLGQCDYIVIATPLTAETRHMIDAAALSVMKHDAVLINLGRGAVVDENALIAALDTNRLRGAALDVFEQEPLPASSPLYGMEQVLVSPHCADNHADWLSDSAHFFVEQYLRFHEKQPLKNLIRLDVGY
jgi:phosphoglycerate dehydrogenase-like enzyme